MNLEDDIMCTPPELQSLANDALTNLLPKKSSHLYEKQYGTFLNWCKKDNAQIYTENVLLAYFSEKAKGPKPIPVIGNLWRFLPVIGNYYDLDRNNLYPILNEKYGKIVKLSNMKLRKDVVILFDPDDIELCYRNEGIWPVREGLGSIKYFKTYFRPDVFQGQLGFFASQGEQWAKVRNASNGPMLQPRAVTKYTGVLNEVAQDFMQHLDTLQRRHPQGEMPATFGDELSKWALESLYTVTFNKRLNLFNPSVLPDPEAVKFLNNTLETFEYMFKIDIDLSFSKWFKTVSFRKLMSLMSSVTEFQTKNIYKALKTMENDIADKSTHELTILQQLDKQDKLFTFSVVFDTVVAGIDTTAKTCASALYFLSKNPLIQEKLINECRSNLHQKDSPITKDTLNNMPYLRAVVKETMRLAPVAVAGLRTLPTDMVYSGYQVPKGTTTIFPHMHLSKQDTYFPRANEFIPERWLRESNVNKNKDLHPFICLPFGFGPRACIGKRLATQELEVFLAKMFRNFTITWPHEDAIWKMKLFYGIESPLKYHIKPQMD